MTPIPSLHPRLLLPAFLVALALPTVRATIPQSAINDPLYAKGYLVVTHYSGVSAGDQWPASTTAGLQEAINDARDNGLALYLPTGTYQINDTLKVYTATGSTSNTNGIVMMGSTSGPRPIIKLTAGTLAFSDAGTPKVMVEFKNFSSASFVTEDASQGYESMIRGIDIDCNASVSVNGKQNSGAIGLYMNLAQDCSVENVKVTATDAYTGILGLPSRGWGAVNIEVDGGKYGIDTNIAGQSNIGTTITGLILKNQTVSAIRHTGHPLTIVGFEIVTLASNPSGLAAIKTATEASGAAHAGALGLVDGKITLGSVPTQAAIDNTALKNLYVRNVYVTGSSKLVMSGSLTSGSGTWALIKEYSYTKQSSTTFDSYTLIDGTATKNGTGSGQYFTTQNNVGAPPADLRSRHVWVNLPSVDDSDAYDPGYTLNNGVATVNASAFNTLLAAHPKMFLRKGTYKFDGPITLNSNTRLFGTARNLTHLQPDENAWQPTSQVTFITTANWVSATTYLGDLEVAVPKIGPTDGSQDYFSALQWRAGADSVLHIASIGQIGSGFSGMGKSLVTITNNGGGRWYFFGRRSGVATQDPNYRILDVISTVGNPLWIYGMNLEHARSDVFAEFTNSDNIRVYGLKTEFAGEVGSGPVFPDCTFVSFVNAHNVVMVGHSALRFQSTSGHNSDEFLKNATDNSDRVLAALIAPQDYNNPQTPHTGTVLETYNSNTNMVQFPSTVSLFKRGTISTTDEALMVHNTITY